MICSRCSVLIFFFFFFNDTATTEIYTLSLHDALPIYAVFLGPVGLEVAEGLAVEAADEAERMRVAGHALQVGAVVGKVAAFLPEMRDDRVVHPAVEIGRAHV